MHKLKNCLIENISLDNLNKTFIDEYLKWANNEKVTEYLYQGTFPITPENCEKLYESITTSQRDIVFGIYRSSTLIGTCGIYDIDWISGVGEFRILIGCIDCWGKHIGQECLRYMIELAFSRYNFHKLWLGYNVKNKKAEESYKKVGMKYECTLKEAHYKNGEYNDLVRMCIFKRDYVSHL